MNYVCIKSCIGIDVYFIDIGEMVDISLGYNGISHDIGGDDIHCITKLGGDKFPIVGASIFEYFILLEDWREVQVNKILD